MAGTPGGQRGFASGRRGNPDSAHDENDAQEQQNFSENGGHGQLADGHGRHGNFHGAVAVGAFDAHLDTVRAEAHQPEFTGIEIGFAAHEFADVGGRRVGDGRVGIDGKKGDFDGIGGLDAGADFGAAGHDAWHAHGDADGIRAGHAVKENIRAADVGLRG